MSFNPEVTKQAQEVVFSCKSQKVTHTTVYFNNSPVTWSSSQKHLGIHLDEKLNFIHHIKEKISKANKGIGVIKKLNNTLPRKALLTLYKSFVRPHLDYGDIIYDQPNNESFCNKLETFQYNATLAITGSIQGTSKVKLYKELGLQSLKSRRWFRRLCCVYKIKTFGFPSYLSNLIWSGFHFYNTRNSEDVVTHHCRTDTIEYYSSLGPFLNGIS